MRTLLTAIVLVASILGPAAAASAGAVNARICGLCWEASGS